MPYSEPALKIDQSPTYNKNLISVTLMTMEMAACFGIKAQW